MRMMRTTGWIGLLLTAAIAIGSAMACGEEGPAEKAGKALDEMADDVEESADEAKERLGDALGE